MKDIENDKDVERFVNEFYYKVREDVLLAPVFSIRIGPDDWDRHLKRMYSFWGTVLLDRNDFRGNPAAKHVSLPIKEGHFRQWLSLFHQTIDECFSGPKAEEAKSRASLMARLFQAKMPDKTKGTDFKSIL